MFYASGKASLETSFLYGMFARFYGHNNLPDSSNMCHETTSVGLKKVIGSPVGTCVLEDFDHCDAIFYFGQNPGSNSPRFLHNLQDAARRGCKIVTFNPVRETGLIRFINPQNPLQMLTGQATELSHQYLQVRPGGDIAAIMGLCKHIVAVDDHLGGVIDRDFLSQHTQGFEAFIDVARAADWNEIERVSGLARADLMAAADVYIAAERVIGVYGMGLTQHVHGTQSIGMLVNLLLLRGNIGRQGAGVAPVRGHSNVQGQRTVGISEKPELVPLDKLAAMFAFEPPREKGRTTVEVCEGVIDGSVRAFLSLGGNFVRAAPEREAVENGLAQSRPDRADFDQTQSQSSRAWPGGVHPALPGALGTGPAGQRSAVGVDRGQLQPYLRLDWAARAGQRRFALRTRHRRRTGQGHPARTSLLALGLNGPPITDGCAT